MKQLLLFLLIFSFTVSAQAGFVAGFITDKDSGEKLIGANILIKGTNMGAASDVNGYYIIKGVTPGKYSIQASYIGYNKMLVEDIIVKTNDTLDVDFALAPASYSTDCCIIVSAQKPVIRKHIASSTSVIALQAGITNSGNTEEYTTFPGNPFFNVRNNPLSTFGADVDGASYSLVRKKIQQGILPEHDAIRAEEFVNYFDYSYVEPDDDSPISVYTEFSECPWNKRNKLVHIGLKGKESINVEEKPSNLVFLIDVSGSMSSIDKLELVKKSFNLLIDELKEDDYVSIVTYSANTNLVLKPTSGTDKEKIKNAVNGLFARGSTAGAAGIQLAYETALENFIDDGNNRVILATDGDFNVGISDPDELEDFIEKKRDSGVFLTCLGFGTGNYKDNRMQILAEKGNGFHEYIGDIEEAEKVFIKGLRSNLYTLAKDVKIQVEFNPFNVKEYRLIGYESRILNAEDFTDDSKDAGEMGIGHTVTALYEIVPNNGMFPEQELIYQHVSLKDKSRSENEVLTVKLRYKEPEKKVSKEIKEILTKSDTRLEDASENFRWSAAAAQFAMILQNSRYITNGNLKQVINLAESAIGKDENGYRAKFIETVNKAEELLNVELSVK